MTTSEIEPGLDAFADLPGGIRLCYRISGRPDAPPLVLIAGLTQQLTAWPEAMVGGLVDAGFRVIRLDNRDTGRSTRVSTPPPGNLTLLLGGSRNAAYTIADMARDVVDLLDHLGIERAHVVGQSMGGMIAQTVAAHYPTRVASLVSLFSTTGNPRVGQAALSTKLLLARRAARTRDEAVAGHLRMIRHLAGRGFPVDTAREAAYAASAWDRAAGRGSEGVARQIQAILASGDRTAELAAITSPTLVVNGDRDLIVDPSGGEATAAAIRGARHVVIRGMGHHLAPSLLPALTELVEKHCHPHPR